jgi:hypothetical protein
MIKSNRMKWTTGDKFSDKKCVFLCVSGLALRPTQPPVPMGARIKRPEQKADHSRPFNAELKICEPILPSPVHLHADMALNYTKDNLSMTIILHLKFRFVLWDILPCKIIVDRRFRGTCCFHLQGDDKTNVNIIFSAVRTWNLTKFCICFVYVWNTIFLLCWTNRKHKDAHMETAFPRVPYTTARRVIFSSQTTFLSSPYKL